MRAFSSNLASQLAAFVEHKQSLGHRYESEVKDLYCFDRFVATELPDTTSLTEHVVRSFVLARPAPSRSNAVSLLRQLGRFLAADDLTVFVAPPRYLNVRRGRASIRVLTLARYDYSTMPPGY